MGPFSAELALKLLPPAQVSLAFRLLLKFPNIYAGFAKCKTVFAALDTDNRGAVTLEELKIGCAKLGYVVSEEEIERTFSATDVDRNQALDVREFIVMLAILHMLGSGEKADNRAGIDADILRTFETDELMSMMHEAGTEIVHHSRTDEESTMQSVIAQRFAELDKDGNGQISFLEFLFCLEGWVIDAEDDDNTLGT